MKATKEQIKEYLDSQLLMTLSTSLNDKPWVASVYYFADDDLNLYFISSPESKHVQDSKTNLTVACAIADSSIGLPEPKVGLQITGQVEEVGRIESIKWFFEMWKKLAPKEEKLTFNSYKNGSLSSKVYRIIPKSFKYMNKDLFEDTYGYLDL